MMLIIFSSFIDVQSQSGYITILDLFNAEKIMIVNMCLIGAVKYREKNHMTVISAGENLTYIGKTFM